MKALSIKQPWALLIVQGVKDIENRRWTTTYRGPLLIHASKSLDSQAMQRFTDYADFARGGIVGVARLVAVVTESESPWFEGPYGFVLQDARSLPFVALRGMQGLFEVKETVHA